jgi:hypothetical protein
MHPKLARTRALTLAGALLAASATARADSLTIGFENPPYTVGSIDGQDNWGGQNPPGIAINAAIDQGVDATNPRTGTQDFRISSFFTSGSFGDQTFSPSLTDMAGEPGAIDGGFAGGTLQPRFTSTIWFASATGSPQNSHVVISPDRGDGARMSWVQVSDVTTDPGLTVTFFDYRLPVGSEVCAPPDGEGKCFLSTVVATGLSRAAYHKLDVEMEFYDGKATDVVRVTVDGTATHRGTSWEDYFLNNQDPPFTGNPPPVDSLLFRVAGAAEGNAGEGFVFDDISYASTPCFAATRYVATGGNDTFNDCRDSSEPCATVQRAVDVACVGDLIEVGAGTFSESVTVPKSVTINGTGSGTTTIQAPGTLPANGTVVTISGSGTSVEVRNLAVAGPGASGCGSIRAGIFVRDGASANIHDNAIRDIRDAPLSGCQNGLGILVGSVSLATTGSATIQDNQITGYQKGGIVVANTGSTATIDGNTVTGVGATNLIAQNGIQVSSGATAQITGNAVSANLCNHVSCGLNGSQSSGILLFDHGLPMTVSGNSVTTTDMGIYHFTTAVGSTNITNNSVTGSRFENVFLDEGSATMTGNTINGGTNYGIQVYSFAGATGNSMGTISCNKIQGNLTGIQLADDDPMDAFVPSITGGNNAISGNGTGAENTTVAIQNLENNYWGSGSGANPPGSGDTIVGPIDANPFLTLLPACIACTSNANCSNGLACDGTETCNAGTCQAGTAVVCVPGQCEASSTCTEPAGTCVPTPKANGVLCSDGANCTIGDTCQGGICTPGAGADTDNDGDCDSDEVACGCNAMDGSEVCVLPNRLVGLPGNGVGEVLINWHTPTVRKPSPATDPSCADNGTCTGGRCTAGQINDLCTTNADCNLPADTCRVIVNWADTSDLTVSFAKVGRTDQTALFSPPSPGCSRKIDLPLDPARPSNRLRVKAKGTIDGRLRQDRDTIIYR